MAWKNIQQRSIADPMLINHDILAELDPVHDLIDWSKVKKHLSHIYAKKLGEKAWRLLLCSRLYVKKGEASIVDASLIQAHSNRPNKDKNGNNTQDVEASWNMKLGSDGKTVLMATKHI